MDLSGVRSLDVDFYVCCGACGKCLVVRARDAASGARCARNGHRYVSADGRWSLCEVCGAKTKQGGGDEG